MNASVTRCKTKYLPIYESVFLQLKWIYLLIQYTMRLSIRPVPNAARGKYYPNWQSAQGSYLCAYWIGYDGCNDRKI